MTDSQQNRARLLQLPLDHRIGDLTTHLKGIVGKVLGVSPAAIADRAACPDPERLMLIVRTSLLDYIEFPLYGSDAPYCRSIYDLAQHVARELEVDPAPAQMVRDLYAGGRWAWEPTRPVAAPMRNSAAVFVISAPRSGSTLLRVMLAGHPSLFAPPELHLLPFGSLGERAAKIDALGYGWMRRGLISALVDLEHLVPSQAERKLKDMEAEDQSVQRVYSLLQELAGSRTLVDKTPTYAFHPTWLVRAERLFEGARYIHLVRQPLASIESFVKMRFHRLLGPHWLVWDENSWAYAEKCWTTPNLHIRAFLETIETSRKLTLKYENLIETPARCAKAVCEFLGLQFNNALLEPYEGERMTRDWSDGGPSVGDPNFLRHSTINVLPEHCVSELPQLTLSEATLHLARTLGYSFDQEVQ